MEDAERKRPVVRRQRSQSFDGVQTIKLDTTNKEEKRDKDKSKSSV